MTLQETSRLGLIPRGISNKMRAIPILLIIKFWGGGGNSFL